MKLLYSILTLSSLGCQTSKWQTEAGYPYHNGLSRYENDEVVCYLFLKDEYPAMDCKFKEQKRGK